MTNTPETETEETAEPLVFDWQAQPDGFLKWMLIHLIYEEIRPKSKQYDRIEEATKGFTDVKVEVTVNGIPVNAVAFFDRIEETMDRSVEHEAAKMIARTPRLDLLYKAVHALEEGLSETIQREASAAGIELPEHWKDSW